MLNWNCLTAAAMLLFLPLTAFAQQDWVTLQGRVIWPEKEKIPARAAVNVNLNRGFFLQNGPLLDDELLIHPGNRGIRNVWVYLLPSRERDAKWQLLPPNDSERKPVTHEVDTPMGQFLPRVLAMRAGDSLSIRNSSPIAHNIVVQHDGPQFGRTVPPQQRLEGPFAAQKGLALLRCGIHSWMSGSFMIFDHPYYALTDADGKFTIPKCPAGDYYLVYRHEGGYHKGKEGRLGWPVTIKDNGKGATVLEPLEFELPKK